MNARRSNADSAKQDLAATKVRAHYRHKTWHTNSSVQKGYSKSKCVHPQIAAQRTNEQTSVIQFDSSWEILSY